MCCSRIGDRECCTVLAIVGKQDRETRLPDAEQLLHVVARRAYLTSIKLWLDMGSEMLYFIIAKRSNVWH